MAFLAEPSVKLTYARQDPVGQRHEGIPSSVPA